jgi:hypothetical protein
MTEDIIDRSDVERVLTDLRFEVPEADAAAIAPAERLRSRTSRFTNGTVHDERRRRLEQLLAGLDPDALATAAASRTRLMANDGAGVDEIAAHVPVACLAEALGFDEPDTLPPLVAVLAEHYPTGGSSDAADAAAVRLLAAAPRPDATEHDDDALRVQLLVQASAATAGLVVGAMRRQATSEASVPTSELLTETLRDAPPVRQTRRIAPDGHLMVLRLDGPDRESPDDRPRTLAFGAGPRACPAPHHALAIAAAIVDGLRA